MNQEAAETSMRSEKRKHDTAPSEQFAEFMKTGWSPSDREGLQPLEVVTYAYSRRQVLSAAFPGTRIVIKAGGYKVRANDTDYNYRPDSAFVYYSGVQGSDATADAVLVLEPNGDSHLTYLYMNPRSTRDTDAFYRDVKYGELWVGRRFTLAEAQETYQIDTRNLSELDSFLADGKKTLTLDDDELACIYCPNNAYAKTSTKLIRCRKQSMQPHLDLTMSSMQFPLQWKHHEVSEFLMQLSMVAHVSQEMILDITPSSEQVHMHAYCTGFAMMAISIAENLYSSMQALS
jgi:hypothetical protein